MSQSSFPVESPYTPMTPSSAPEIPRLTVSPSETTLKFEDVVPDIKIETPKPSEKKPVKKRKSWGQELPTPKTNLPPRKRAKTEDEKEQRRIERVLRNRAAAQISRERKRLEIEKLEGEKLKIEQQNEYLLRRLAQMEEENNRLNRQVAKLSSEIHSSRGTSPQSITGIPSPTLTPILFKQEQDDLSLDKIAYPSPSSADLYSPTLSTLDLQESSDMTQHPAAQLFNPSSDLCPPPTSHHPPPLSDDDLRRLFDGDSTTEPDLSLLEGGLSFDLLSGGDLSAFAFDSMVDLDPEPVEFEDLGSSIGFPDPTSHQTASMQPSYGASFERCDEQGIAAGS
ncbi:hypothetical protein FQN57_002327 [Myotisia sp. PD_48]|nr:hypothetical protein FQN57_002327 [Myotisia sp. PD_48]